jgi:hypothetical protein
MPRPCRSPAMPCRYVFRLCLFIWITQCGRVWFTHACTCRARAVPRLWRSESYFSRPRYSTAWARHGQGMGAAWHVWIRIGRRETACGRPARVRLLPATTRSSAKVVIRSIPISNLNAGGQCETKQRLLKLILVQEDECCLIYSTKITIKI